jgi:hypothetical protein
LKRGKENMVLKEKLKLGRLYLPGDITTIGC